MDDVYGSRHARGLAGHARALVAGRLTTGMLKAAGGAVVGVAASAWSGQRGWWILPAGMVVALCANLANLLDVRPGRCVKAWLVCWAATLTARPPAGALAVSAAVAGGVLAFAPFDLRERAMLGDTGANLLGGVLGVVAVVSLGRTALLASLGCLIALTALSEVVSFTRLVAGIRPLRFLDELGRK